MKSKIALILLLVISSAACASKPTLASSFHAVSDRFTYLREKHEVNIPLRPSMSDWNVNCERTRAIVWGRAWDQIEVGDSPFSRVYILDLHRNKVLSEFTMAQGPFEAIFGQDKRYATIDDEVIDLTSGKMIGMMEDIEVAPELCPLFPGKQSD